jgi:DNA modification methylase
MFGIVHEWIFIFGNKKILNRTNPNNSYGEKKTNHLGNRQKDGSIKKPKEIKTVQKYRQLDTVINQGALKSRNNDYNHPAMYPVELPQKYIEACSNESDIIFEPFLGSGSTLIACEKTNRNCYGMEIDPHYCSVIIKRWQEFTGKTAVLCQN